MQNRIATYARALAWGWARRHAPRRWFFIWLALVGCSGPNLHEFRLVGGSAEQQDAVRRAALAWNHAARRIVIAETAEGAPVHLDPDCLRPGYAGDHAGFEIHEQNSWAWADSEDGQIWLCLPRTDGVLEAAAAHEFGHALGLDDSTEQGTIMGPGWETLGGPTEADGGSV